MRTPTNIMKSAIKSLILDSQVFRGVILVAAGGSVGTLEKRLDEIDNDLDLFVVADAVVGDVTLLEARLNALVGTKYSDIKFYNTQRFIRLAAQHRVSQCDFDNLHSKFYFYGEFPKAPVYGIRTVKFSSAATVLLTRLWCVLSCSHMGEDFNIVRSELNFCELQLRKAVSAIVDSLLIYHGLYVSEPRQAKALRLRDFIHNDCRIDKDLETLLQIYLGQSSCKDYLKLVWRCYSYALRTVKVRIVLPFYYPEYKILISAAWIPSNRIRIIRHQILLRSFWSIYTEQISPQSINGLIESISKW